MTLLVFACEIVFLSLVFWLGKLFLLAEEREDLESYFFFLELSSLSTFCGCFLLRELPFFGFISTILFFGLIGSISDPLLRDDYLEMLVFPLLSGSLSSSFFDGAFSSIGGFSTGSAFNNPQSLVKLMFIWIGFSIWATGWVWLRREFARGVYFRIVYFLMFAFRAALRSAFGFCGHYNNESLILSLIITPANVWGGDHQKSRAVYFSQFDVSWYINLQWTLEFSTGHLSISRICILLISTSPSTTRNARCLGSLTWPSRLVPAVRSSPRNLSEGGGRGLWNSISRATVELSWVIFGCSSSTASQ